MKETITDIRLKIQTLNNRLAEVNGEQEKLNHIEGKIRTELNYLMIQLDRASGISGEHDAG